MASVTQRINEIKQPRGGYIKPKEFIIFSLEDNEILNNEENIHSSIVGLTVDYMTRFLIGSSHKSAFQISLLGASIINELKYANELLYNIKGLDDNSIINACKLSSFDVFFRSNIRDDRFNKKNLYVSDATIKNIRIMINRSLKFFEKYGPIVKDSFTFEGGYTNIIQKGDGDFLTKDTLWDFKVSKNTPTSKNTLQLLIYYLMGKHSIHSEFESIDKIGIFNPRLNNIYLLEISNISDNVIYEVSKNIIGY